MRRIIWIEVKRRSARVSAQDVADGCCKINDLPAQERPEVIPDEAVPKDEGGGQVSPEGLTLQTAVEFAHKCRVEVQGV